MDKPEILTLGIFAHANAGKTTLTEQILYHTHVNEEAGRVDHGTTTTDNLSVEKERGISVKSALVTFELDNKLVQLIDTPGHIDFTSEVVRAVNVLDGAIIVISAVEKVEPQTITVWNYLRQRNIPTIFFVNKIDRLGADYDKTVSDIINKLSEHSISMKTITIDKETSKINYTDTPDDYLFEQLSDVDDGIMELYINDKPVSHEFLMKKINDLSSDGKLFCIYGGSALVNEGVEELLKAIREKLPGKIPTDKNDLSAYVYTIKNDSSGKKTYVKILNGTLNNRDTINVNDEEQKVRGTYKIIGNKTVQCDKLQEGEVGVITGIDANVGEILGNSDDSLKIIKATEPLFYANVDTYNIEDKIKLIKALTELNEEDPNLNCKYDNITHKICIDLMGPLQAEVLSNIIQERYGIQPIFTKMDIIKRETPQTTGVGSACYDGLSEVELTVKPLPRGSGVVFKSTASTDYLYSKYQKQIEKLLKYYSNQGLYGWQVDDIEICISGGKSDSVCSRSSHYNIVTPLAFMRALKNANMIILDPIMDYEIIVNEKYSSDILKLLLSYNINYDKIDFKEDECIIVGKSPLKSLLAFQPAMVKATNGYGILTKNNSGYDISYDNIEEKEYIGPDPRHEEGFLLNMKVKPEILGKTKKIVKDKRSKRERSLERRNRRY